MLDSITSLTTVQAPTDSEGYSQRPAALDPISQAEQYAATERNEPQYKVDIKDAPVTHDSGDVDALANVSNTLKMVRDHNITCVENMLTC